MMRIILPIERKLQSRPRFARRGNYVQTYEDSAMGAYKQKAKPELIEKGAIFAHITFYIATPKISLSSKKKRLEVKLERKYCDKKPDLDNYFKAVQYATTNRTRNYKFGGTSVVGKTGKQIKENYSVRKRVKKMLKFKEFNIQLFDVHIYIKRLSSFKTNKK